MKRRLFELTLALLLVLSLAACGGSKSAEFTAEAPSSAADMAFLLVLVQNYPYLFCKLRVELPEARLHVLMHRGFADAELPRGCTHRGFMLDNVFRKRQHAFFYISVHKTPPNKLCKAYEGVL